MAKQKPAQKENVYIAGESPLVEEFADVCARHGFALTVQWNGRPSGRHARGEMKHSSTIPANTRIALELTNTEPGRKRRNLERIDRALRRTGIILSSSVVVTVTEQASWIRRPARLIGISALPSLVSRQLIEFSAAPATEKQYLLEAQEFFMQLGKQVSVVQDRIGMVLPRILCMIINEAYFALQESIASPADIDIAMKLGTNYPRGPIEWGEEIGLRQVRSVLVALRQDLGEDRYRVAPLLTQMAG